MAGLKVGFIPIEGGHFYHDALEEVVRGEEQEGDDGSGLDEEYVEIDAPEVGAAADEPAAGRSPIRRRVRSPRPSESDRLAGSSFRRRGRCRLGGSRLPARSSHTTSRPPSAGTRFAHRVDQRGPIITMDLPQVGSERESSVEVRQALAGLAEAREIDAG